MPSQEAMAAYCQYCEEIWLWVWDHGVFCIMSCQLSVIHLTANISFCWEMGSAEFPIWPFWWWSQNVPVKLLGQCHGCGCPGSWFNIKMSSYQYRKSHCGDKTVVRSSYLYNGISYAGKISSLYWIGALASCIARTSAAMVLTMLDKQVLIMHMKRIPLTAPSTFCEMIENMNIYFMFSKIIQHDLHCNLHCWS